MSEPAIQFHKVTKRFHLDGGQPSTILERFINLTRGQRVRSKREMKAVDNVSFEIMPGQCVGIIGRNGSGKSTVLKLCTQILRPNEGHITVNGRVSALLELGTGFHQDLTGRENVFLNASLLGLPRSVIEERYDQIVAFSELHEFMDVPVKNYSSGMYMRLGFSVAIHVDPDILIIDEILAVGDQAFQTKCFERIYEMREAGTTIVIVSHDLDTMRKLCSHIVWMEQGVVRMQGTVEEVAGRYLEYAFHRKSSELNFRGSFRRWGSGEIEITAVKILNEAGEESEMFHTGSSLTVDIHYVAHKPINDPEFGLAIHRRQGNVHINGPNNMAEGVPLGVVEGPGVVRYHIPELPLLPAEYLVTAAVHDSLIQVAYDFHDHAYPFRIIHGSELPQAGICAIPAVWEYRPGKRTEVRSSPLEPAEGR